MIPVRDEQATPKQPVILIVEDDPALLAGLVDLLTAALEPAPKAILQARNGREALDLLAQQTPDLIISDLQMPVVDGYTLLTSVRARPEWIHIPFILLTARGSHAELNRGRLTGAESYIVKPFDSRELIERITTQLSKSYRQQAVRQQRTDRLKRDILRMLQHEFRTPLTYVTAYFEFLWMSYNEAHSLAELGEHLKGVSSGSERLMRLVSDLIEALEIRTGERNAAIEANMRPIDDVAAIFRTTGAARAADAQGSAIAIVSDIPQRLPTVSGDPAALREIFDRLIDNAIKFIRARGGPGTVRLHARAEGDQLLFEIEDDGIGFPPHVRETIFDLFYQHDRSYWEQQGSGVGLTIARDLARLHKGQLLAEGAPNVGAKLMLYLPIARQTEPAAHVSAHRPRINILIVEDDQMLLEGLRDLLEYSSGTYRYEVQMAANGRQALERLNQVLPQLILCDIGMPIMNGYAFLEAVRQNPEWLDIPFVFLTAYGDPRDIHRGHVLGVDEYVTKPYDSQMLLRIIETRLDRYFEQSRSAARDFDLLKQQVLASIGSNIIDSLSSISLHSSEIRDLIDGSALSASQTMADLKRSLLGIQASSSRLARLVQNATTLIELRTGATAETFIQRRRPLDNLTSLIGVLSENMTGRSGPDPSASAAPKVVLDLPDALPPILSEPRTFETLLQHATQYLLVHSARGADTTLRIAARPIDRQVAIAISSNRLRADDLDAARIGGFLATGDNLPHNDEGATDLAIVHESARLHDGYARLERSPSGYSLILFLPRAD